jgi:regulator of protease activity HflC (stomatin/prohibitin superfamily)
MNDRFEDHVRGYRDRHGYEDGGMPVGKVILGSAAVLLIVVIAAVLFLVEQVNATNECAVTSFGREVGTVGPGIRLTGIGTDYHCYTVSQKTMELVAGDPAQSNSKADYVDWAIRARTLDGIDQYAMLTMQYHVDRAAVSDLYPTYPNDEAVKEQIIKSRLRSIVPQVLSLTDANVQYKGNLGPISDDIEAELKKQLEPFGIRVDYFELKRSDFDDRFEEAIRNRSTEVELAEKKRLEQETARQEAERLAIATAGENAARLAKAETDNAVRKANTDAEVYDLEQRANALQENPSLIQWEQTQAIRDAGAVYLPSGALPIYTVPEAAQEDS